MAGQATSTDRRVVTIGVATMVVFLLIGVGSAAVFSRPACRLVAPSVAAAPVAYDTANLGDAFADDVALAGFVSAVEALSGTPAKVVAAEEINRFTLFGDQVAAIGTQVLVFDATANVHSRITFRDGHALGSGAVLYAVTITNPDSGQADAVQPFTPDGSALTCVELALVSSPLAFVKDAADGEVLFLRADEDGDDPFLEVRDPDSGRRLTVPLELQVGSAGTHGVRTQAVLHPDMIVATQAITERLDATAVWGIDRTDGQIRFAWSAATVREAFGVAYEGTLGVRLRGNDVVLTLTDDALAAGPFVVSLEDGTLTSFTGSDPLFDGHERYASVLTEHPDILLRGVHTLDDTDLLLLQTPANMVIVRVGSTAGEETS